MKHFRLVIWALLLAATFVSGGVFFSEYSESFTQRNASLSIPFIDTTTEASIDQISQFLGEEFYYQDRLEDQKSLDIGAVKGLVDALDDPYTVFYSQDEYSDFQSSLAGTFEGIGAEIGIRDDQLIVVSPLADSPSEAAGLLPQDQILGIDGESTVGMTVEEAVVQIRGEQGTEVVLTVRREGSARSQEITITRDVIDVPNVSTEIVDNVGVIQIRQFQQDTAREVSTELSQLEDQGINQVLLDLRFNTGGYLQASVDLVDLFVPKGEVVVSEIGRDGEVIKEFETKLPAVYDDVEVLVLMNEGSASAAEITAAALRDISGVTLVGKQTFGKGVVQEIQAFGDDGVLKYTVAEWQTPAGDKIHDIGLTPDVEVDRTEEDFLNDRDPQLDRAVELIKE